MKVDRGSNLLYPFPERIERRVIKVLTVSMSVDHGTTKSEVAYAPFEFVPSRNGILHGEVCEAGVAVWAPLDFACQEFVRLAGFAACRAHVALGLHTWPGQAKDGLFDPRSVHSFEA